MKIAIINSPNDTLLTAQQNSAGLWSYHIAKRLQVSADVTVFGKRKSDQKPIEWDGRVCYRLLRTGSDSLWQELSSLADGWRKATKPFFSSALHYLPYALRIALAVRRERFDIVHIHNSTNFVPIIRAFNPHVPIVLHMNCELLSQLDKKLMARRIRRSNLVLGNSKYLRDTIREAYPEFADRVKHVYHGVDTAFFHPEKTPKLVDENTPPQASNAASDAPTNTNETTIDQTVFATVVPQPNRRAARRESKILFVGRVSPEKGVHDLITAFTQIAAHVPQATLEIIGLATPMRQLVELSDSVTLRKLAQFDNGDYLSQLQKMVPSHLEKRIKFVGHLPQNEVLKRYQDCALVVSPSYSESFGVSLAEAGACGKPVVATKVGGIADIVIDGETGFLVERGDVHLMAQGIGILLQDFDEQLRMGRNARVRVKHLFDWDEVAKSILNAYQQLLSHEKRIEKAVPSTI